MKDGGSAFPCYYPHLDQQVSGMSLRDYFAAKAMQGWLSTYECDQPAEMVDHKQNATLAYAAADAMLAEREK